MAIDQTLFETALKAFIDREADYDLYHDYYNGDHRLAFATTKFANAFGSSFREFAINICPTVVDTLADRLQLEGFEVLPDPESDIVRDEESVQRGIREVWEANRFDQRQHETHHETFMTGDGYVIVWPDQEGMPIIWPQEASQIMLGINVDNPSKIDWGLKIWATPDNYIRVTFYQSDFIYKYISINRVNTGLPKARLSDYTPYKPTPNPNDPEAPEAEPWPLPNTLERVPIFPFRNNSGNELEGRSELRDIIPVQDAINKTIMDMLVGQEYFSLPQRWATGIELLIGQDGKPQSPFDNALGKLWANSATDVKFGQFPAADVTQLQVNADKLLTKVAIIARIPLHFISPITGDRWPSGESLKTAESPFVAKIRDRMTIFGNGWEDVFAFCLAIIGLQDVRLQARWKDPNPRAESEQIEHFQILVQTGVPLDVAATMAKMDPEVIVALAAVEAEKKRQAELIQQQAQDALAAKQAAQPTQAAASTSDTPSATPSAKPADERAA